MFNFKEDDDLFRGIHPNWWSISDNRPSSAAFADEEMSVDWCKFSTPLESLERYKRMFCLTKAGLSSIKVRDAKSLGQKVIYNPCEKRGEYNLAHTLVTGKKTKSIARKFARNLARVIYPLEI